MFTSYEKLRLKSETNCPTAHMRTVKGKHGLKGDSVTQPQKIRDEKRGKKWWKIIFLKLIFTHVL